MPMPRPPQKATTTPAPAPGTINLNEGWIDYSDPNKGEGDWADYQEPSAAPATPTPLEVRYTAPGQGIQSFTQGSQQEQDFLKRFPGAKVVPNPRNPSATGPLVTTPRPLPPGTPTQTPAEVAAQSKQDLQTTENVAGNALPMAGAAAMTAAGAPELGAIAGTGLNMLGAAAGEGAKQIYNRVTGAGPVPSTGKEALGDMATTGAEYGALDTLLKGGTVGAKAVLRTYFPEIHEAVEYATDALFRAAPDADAIGYRANLEAAAPDLQKIAKQSLTARTGVFDPKAPGGFFSTEYRPTNLYKDTNTYMRGMYQNEVAPMVQAADQAGARVQLVNLFQPGGFQDREAIQGVMKFLSKVPDYEEGADQIAKRVMADPSAPITMTDAEILVRRVNALNRQAMRAVKTGSDAALKTDTNKIAAMSSHVDKLLGDAIDAKMTQYGQPGIRGFERRYAALSDFRDNLWKTLAPTEQQRLGIQPTTYLNPRGVGSRFYLRMGNNPGRQIESAMTRLARADDIPMGALGAQPVTPQPAVATPVGGAGGAGGQLPPPGGAGAGAGAGAPGGGGPPRRPWTGGPGGPLPPASPAGQRLLPPGTPAQLPPAPEAPPSVPSTTTPPGPSGNTPGSPPVPEEPATGKGKGEGGFAAKIKPTPAPPPHQFQAEIDKIADHLVSNGMDRVQAEEAARKNVEAFHRMPGYQEFEYDHAKMMRDLYGLSQGGAQ